MGSEIDTSGKMGTVMEVSPVVVEDGKSFELPQEKLGNCISNREDDAFQMEVFQGGNDNGVGSGGNGADLEVDVVGNITTDEGEERGEEVDSQDATECSSSFGCTDSENGTAGTSGDMEVESQVRSDNTMSMGVGGCSDVFGNRKKRVTPHWRKYVHPLMWRCKWVELQIRELQSQASKYVKELAECDERKQFELEKVTTEDHAMKLAPFVCQNRSVKLMKRKKRKRVEETEDLTSYTTSHSLFSYFVNKRSGADTGYMDDHHLRTGKAAFGNGEFGFDDELPSLGFKDCDAFEGILRKIEEAQIQVRQLRLRMDKVVGENAEKFAVNQSKFASRELTSCGLNSMLPHVNDEPALLGSMPPYTWSPKTLVMPETAASIPEDAAPADMIKTTADPQVGVKCDKIEKEIRICNRAVKEEFDTSKDVRTQLLAEPPPEPEGKVKLVQHVPDSNLRCKVKMPQEQPTAKMRNSSKTTSTGNKRKRGRRKARAGKWSKKSSG